MHKIYSTETRERWGNTDAYREHEKKTKKGDIIVQILCCNNQRKGPARNCSRSHKCLEEGCFL